MARASTGISRCTSKGAGSSRTSSGSTTFLLRGSAPTCSAHASHQFPDQRRSHASRCERRVTTERHRVRAFLRHRNDSRVVAIRVCERLGREDAPSPRCCTHREVPCQSRWSSEMLSTAAASHASERVVASWKLDSSSTHTSGKSFPLAAEQRFERSGCDVACHLNAAPGRLDHQPCEPAGRSCRSSRHSNNLRRVSSLRLQSPKLRAKSSISPTMSIFRLCADLTGCSDRMRRRQPRAQCEQLHILQQRQRQIAAAELRARHFSAQVGQPRRFGPGIGDPNRMATTRAKGPSQVRCHREQHERGRSSILSVLIEFSRVDRPTSTNIIVMIQTARRPASFQPDSSKW